MNGLQTSIVRWQIFAFVMLALSLAATVAAWRTAETLDRRAAQENFAGQANLAAARIETRMTAYELVLRSSKALFSGSTSVNRAEWRDYVAALDLDNTYPGVLGLGFAQRIRPADMPAHVAGVRAQGFPAYEIWPAGKREEYTSVVFIEPFNERNREALGYDMMSEEIRHTAMERARDSGKSTLSGKVQLLQEITADKQPGFLLYLPVYANGSDPADVATRRASLIGYVYSPFRAYDLMHRTLGDDFPQISVEVYDGGEVNEASMLYDGQAGGSAASANIYPELQSKVSIAVAGRTWTLVFRPTADFAEAHGQAPATLTLISGVIISLLLFLVIWSLVNTRQRALRLLQIAEQEREGLEAKFRDLFDFSHDAIVLVDGEGTISDVNAQAEATFGYSQSELIGQKIEALVPGRLAASHVELRNEYLLQPRGRMMAAHLMDIKGLRKDGTEFDASVSLTPIAAGEQILVAAGIRDLTDKIATETQLRQAQKMEAVGNLTGGMAHDFNNLLNVIIGNLDLLDELQNPDPVSRGLAHEALDAALRGAGADPGVARIRTPSAAGTAPVRYQRAGRRHQQPPGTLLGRKHRHRAEPGRGHLADHGRSLPVGSKPRQYREQCCRCHAFRWAADNLDQQQLSGPRLRLLSPGTRCGRLRARRNQRYRPRDAGRCGEPDIRAVLHHQAARNGDRARPQHGLRVCQAVWRPHQCVQRSRRGNDIQALPAQGGQRRPAPGRRAHRAR